MKGKSNDIYPHPFPTDVFSLSGGRRLHYHITLPLRELPPPNTHVLSMSGGSHLSHWKVRLIAPFPSSTTNIFSPSGGSHCNLFLSNWPGIFANSPQDLFWHFNNYFEICSLCKSFLSLINKFYAVSIYAEENNLHLLTTHPLLEFGHANMHFLHLIRIHCML